MMKCILVDDEPLALGILEKYIRQYGQLELVKKCPNAMEAFAILHSEKIDLMFLDIQMPVINGIDFLRSLKHPPKVIITTAFSEFALQGFELDVVDYLLKPITYERFEKSMNKLFRMVSDEDKEEKNYTYFKISGQLVKIPHAELLFAQSLKDYITLKTPARSYLTHMTMKYLSTLLPPDHFTRVHRSYIINKVYVEKLEKNLVTVAGHEIPVGEHYRDELLLKFKSKN